jgi:hypothetical protein
MIDRPSKPQVEHAWLGAPLQGAGNALHPQQYKSSGFGQGAARTATGRLGPEDQPSP